MSASKQRQKHIPQRMCIVCRQKFEKRRLTRLVSTSDGVVVDLTGKLNGRGAYLCHQSSCRESVLTGRLLAQVLRTKITDTEREALVDNLRTAEHGRDKNIN